MLCTLSLFQEAACGFDLPQVQRAALVWTGGCMGRAARGVRRSCAAQVALWRRPAKVSSLSPRQPPTSIKRKHLLKHQHTAVDRKTDQKYIFTARKNSRFWEIEEPKNVLRAKPLRLEPVGANARFPRFSSKPFQPTAKPHDAATPPARV